MLLLGMVAVIGDARARAGLRGEVARGLLATMTRIGHLMTRDPVTIRSTTSLAQAARLMIECGLRHLPVVDGDGVLIGMISDRDLRGPLIGSGEAAPVPTAAVDAIMARELITARAEEELGAVARRIVDERIGAVAIVDAGGVLVGIASYVDVLRRLADDADADARSLERIDGH
jgi:acetoin utilization protein AcuB